jgi:hypothetical protein
MKRRRRLPVLLSFLTLVPTQSAWGGSLGDGEARLTTGSAESGSLLTDPNPGQGDGRIRWRFRTGRWMNRQFVEVGPDGTVYTSDILGLYALDANSVLQWFVPGAGGGRPIDIGPDGTIYTSRTPSGGLGIIKALNPDGSLRWEFVPPASWDLVAGPNVGPDGNIYASQEWVSEGGLGFFSLDPEGNLRWSNRGDPPLDPNLQPTAISEIVFASDRLYVSAWFLRSGQPTTYAFSLDGEQIWYTGTSDLDTLFHSFPRVDPQDRAIGVWGQTGITALLPDGETDWITLHPNPNSLQLPAVDSAGNIYTGDLIGIDLWSLAPDGSTRWFGGNRDGGLTNLGVTPDGQVVVATGWVGPGQTWVGGFDAATGAPLWRVLLPRERRWPQHSTNLYPVFSADSRTAYITTAFSNVDEVDHGYLFALSTQG